MAKVPGVKGTTFGVEIDSENHVVYIAGEEYVRGEKETSIFTRAYVMGRDHKKLEIRSALNL